jgi:hypothetical protein
LYSAVTASAGPVKVSVAVSFVATSVLTPSTS